MQEKETPPYYLKILNLYFLDNLLNFIGLTGGIMDQSTILNGKKNKVLLIDCKNRNFDFIDSDFGRYKFLLLNTNIEHKLSDSLYNMRVGECRSALNEIKSRYKKVNSQVEPIRHPIQNMI